jgi:hypothetical protein
MWSPGLDFMANFDINKAGFVIVGVFVLTWAVALSVWHFGHIEQRWGHAAARAKTSPSGVPRRRARSTAAGLGAATLSAWAGRRRRPGNGRPGRRGPWTGRS